MDDIDIRRYYISDLEWNRTSSSWKELRPLRNFNQSSVDDETVAQCFGRLSAAGFSIPYLVIEQWLYIHYYNHNTVNNYGWIDYRSAVFTERVLDVDELKKLYVVQQYRDYVESRSKSKPFDEFMCISKDLDYWKTQHTWRTPPIVLDFASLQNNMPSHAEIGGIFQLIEGHSRLGYLLALERSGLMPVREHRVFLLCALNS